MRRAQRRTPAMGSNLHVIVWAPGAAADRLADLAVLRVQLLEACWSRFRPNSELNRLNARAGAGAVAVSDDLHRLVTTCVAAYAWTEGDLDASVLRSMLALGYRHDFGSATMAFPIAPVPAPGMTQVCVGESWVALPSGLGLDPGAVGKGLAGDMVTEDIHSAGAHAVLVGIGGDVVTRGVPPDTDSWLVSMHDDRSDGIEIDALRLDARHRAVATSSTLRRRWPGAHHVVQPRTGRPTRSDVVQATVLADCGWHAEAAATVAVVRGTSCAGWLVGHGCTPRLLSPEDGGA